MRKVFASLALIAGLTVSALYADPIDNEIEKAMQLYPKNKTAALTIMTNLYHYSSGQILKIRQVLTSRGFYTFYMEFLRLLPKTKPVAGEIIYQVFATSDFEFLADDIRGYLGFYDKEILINYYYKGIAEDKAVTALAGEIGDPVFFELLKRSLILAGTPEKFDKVLIEHKSKSILPDTVKKFIIESWRYKIRDLGPLIAAYGLADDTVLRPFYLYSLFVNNRFAEIIELYLKDPSLYPKDAMTSYQIDVPYYVAYSYYRTGDYAKAMEMIGKIYMPWNVDINKFITLCYLGKSDYKQVKMWMPKMKSNDTFQFIKGFTAILEGRTNEGIQSLELYLSDTSAAHLFTVEALLLAFTYYNNPSELPEVAGLVKLALLDQPLPGTADVSLSQAYAAGKDTPVQPSQSKIIDDFVVYKNCVQMMKKGKYDEASQALTKLIKSPETSPLIRALAVFQLRKIPQG
ncbi:MAG: hypothetical protein A2Y33_05885 [Spirochaetes bacterium GWF1_51_8]|nr:MAG: hypothetical protein A2Y33_05885 [Spirochaetes bacterium GWF1_51_8]